MHKNVGKHCELFRPSVLMWSYWKLGVIIAVKNHNNEGKTERPNADTATAKFHLFFDLYLYLITPDLSVHCARILSLFTSSFGPRFQVPGPQCRSAVGSILSEGEDQADEELLRSYETSGFKVFSFPEVTHVVTASFPHRTFFSVLLGMRRVYPRLEDHIKVFCQSLPSPNVFTQRKAEYHRYKHPL